MDAKTIQKYMVEIQNSDKIKELFGRLVSGKSGYNTVIVKDKPTEKCACGKILTGDEKFCPECGSKIEPKKQ